MTVAAGLLRDTIPPLALANRYGVGLLIELLDRVAAASHAAATGAVLAATGPDDCDDGLSVTSEMSSNSVASSVASSAVGAAAGAAHCSISALHRTARAGLRGYLAAVVAVLGTTNALLDRAGVEHGAAAQLALGCDISHALKQVVPMLAALAVPEDCTSEDVVTSLRALALLQQATARIPLSTEAAWHQSADARDELETFLRFALATYGAGALKCLRMLKPLLRPSGFGGKLRLSPRRVEAPRPARLWADEDVEAFERLAGIDADIDLVRHELRSAAFRPGYVLSICQRRRSVVLALRGTCHPLDFLTDLVAEPAPLAALGQVRVGGLAFTRYCHYQYCMVYGI